MLLKIGGLSIGQIRRLIKKRGRKRKRREKRMRKRRDKRKKPPGRKKRKRKQPPTRNKRTRLVGTRAITERFSILILNKIQ